MSAWLRQHRQAAASALRRLGLLNALVIGVALSLPAGGYALLESLRGVAGRFTLDMQLTLFLHPAAKRAEADAVRKALRADQRIAKVRFVPREQALKDGITYSGRVVARTFAPTVKVIVYDYAADLLGSAIVTVKR